jgi:hypothetical protein
MEKFPLGEPCVSTIRANPGRIEKQGEFFKM